MEPTTEPRTDLIIAMLELIFNGISVVTNLIVAQLPDLFTSLFTQILTALGIA